ncbi:alpha-L-fucosidase [Rhizobium calliandrae]|uniref:Alpha-L-fucosidase n=1 Tax=Rhizobium calliandrae TaxID=1312182 RepID=A0ABT7KBK5_9HYPH|nr:beta-galactosidase trimerization domain-containing protein [Rhizobium calliandrae]MDL2405988.1 alpha-L-fucosidase [Rhizobium calliandrae]
MPATTNKPLRYRQIHLDFHTSEHIPGIGAEFDPDNFVDTLKKAHVDSITIFAKCHHGWSYYPTKVGKPHPHLARPDLLGDMVKALAAADIESPIYISVQWDELSAREHPEWRAMSASNRYHHALPADPSSGKQLSPAWHTLCLNHEGLRKYILDQAREVAQQYPTQGLFFDIILTPDCVCPACVERMQCKGLDPENPADRLKNDEAVNEQFRRETSEALFAEFPGLRVFYNCGHIHKQGPERFSTYSHLELESLPTGGWGYDHFPSSARYAATLGMDFLAHTGKFHTSWGEFGGFKHPDALEYECAQMVALGSKCLVGDQLHPNGAINPDTYKSIAAAYARVEKLEPFLEGAKQVSEIAIVSAEHMSPSGARNHPSDDGAAQMLQELQRPFDVIDLSARFENYRLLVLPDEIPVNAALASRLKAYLAGGGKLIASWHSGLGENGAFAIDMGIARAGGAVAFKPSYVKAGKALDPDMPESAFVFYDDAETVKAGEATLLAEIYPSYFNRSYKHYSSHQHAPDDPAAAPLGAAVTEHNGAAYIAYPIFRLYRAMGQPLYKYIVRGLLDRLIPDPAMVTDLPSSGRATLARQIDQHRHILHLLYGPPQIRGKDVRGDDGSTRMMEMIEDIPSIGPVTAKVRLPSAPSRVYDALTGADIAWNTSDDGTVSVTVPRLRIHTAVVFEGT